MNLEEEINKLIDQSVKFTFENNSHTVPHGTFTRASVPFQTWVVECEYILENYSTKESLPWKIFQKLDKRKFNGFEKIDFNDQKELILSALKAYLRSPGTAKNEILAVHNSMIDKTQVFIVHGHDELAKTETARFIERLGLKPIILHEQASSGQTIIEKIESNTNVGFGIILYTPCDLGAKKGTEGTSLKNRARQNVVFEHGYLIGKIGRNNVCALVKDNIETPNDISGVVYVTMDEHKGWHLKIAKELKKSGYSIDLNVI